MAISADRIFVQKEAEKKVEYKTLWIEIKRPLSLKCRIIPVIYRATRILTEDLRKTLEAIAGKHSNDSIKKTDILGTSHITWKVLYSETGSLSSGDHRWFRRSTRRKRPVTRENQKIPNNNISNDDDNNTNNNNNTTS